MPLFPVILKPKCVYGGTEHNHFTMENVQSAVSIYVSLRTNIENVTYINLFEFLFRELELRIELDHLMTIFEFVGDFNEKFAVGLAASHEIFHEENAALLASSKHAEEFKDLDQLDVSLEPKANFTKEEVKADGDSSEELTDDEDAIEAKRKKAELKTWRS